MTVICTKHIQLINNAGAVAHLLYPCYFHVEVEDEVKVSKKLARTEKRSSTAKVVQVTNQDFFV